MSVLLISLLAGCPIENNPNGTAVGNPTGMAFTAAPATEFTYTSASVKVDAVNFTACAGGVTPVAVGETVDLLEGTDLTAPAGTWCTVEVAFADVVHLVGTSSAGFTGELLLDVGRVRFANAGGFVVDANPIAAELGEPGWFDPALIGADTEDVVVVDGALAGLLVAEVRSRSALFGDSDGDGVISDAERAAGPYAVAAADDDDGDEDSR